MKEKMLEFLFKRMGHKIDDLSNIDFQYEENVERAVEFIVSDMRIYLETIREVAKEALLP